MPNAETWPRLSETLPGPRHPGRCQSCGAESRGTAPLDIWQEHDQADRKEAVYVVLCRPCADRIVDPHPRLYGRLPANAPAPGAMALCVECRHRRGTRCVCPSARINGGDGINLSIARPTRAHVCRSPRRLSGWETIWPKPAHACSGREITVTPDIGGGPLK